MPSQSLKCCSGRHWKIRNNLPSVVFVSPRLVCLAAFVPASDLLCDLTQHCRMWKYWASNSSFPQQIPTASDLVCGAATKVYSPCWYVHVYTIITVYTTVARTRSILQACCVATAIFVNSLQNPINLCGWWSTALDRSANFLTFLHHKFLLLPFALQRDIFFSCCRKQSILKYYCAGTSFNYSDGRAR